jgi:hypothetical protein
MSINADTVLITNYCILVSFKNFGIQTPKDGMTPKHSKNNKTLYFYASTVLSLVLGMNYTKASRLGTWDLCTPEVKLFHFISITDTYVEAEVLFHAFFLPILKLVPNCG